VRAVVGVVEARTARAARIVPLTIPLNGISANNMQDRPKPLGRAATSPPCDVLLRGLSVLEALNGRPVSTVEGVAKATGLPKPTVVRMLGVLVSAGFAQRLPRRRGYMLDERALDLSSGFRSQDAVVETARPHLSAFTAKYKWPLVLATLDIDAMRIRASTAQESPFSAVGDRAYFIYRRVAILPSAIGRAYIALCPDEERNALVALLRVSPRAIDRPAQDPRYIEALVRGVRKDGFASSDVVPGDVMTGVAIPIFIGETVLGTLAIRYFHKAISERDMVQQHLEPLRRAAAAIAESYAERDRAT
jgi:IclR family mhp operon transcriptional activator